MGKKLARFWCGLALAWASILQAETFVIGVEDNRYLPHYSFENGEYTGFGRDVLDAFFTDSGLSYEFRALPVTRLFSTFISGGVDFKYPDNEIWSAQEKEGIPIRYSKPVVAYIDGVSVVPEKLDTPIDEIGIIGTVRGFSAWDWQDRIEAGKLILSENSSTEKLIQQALDNKIHGAYANIDVIQYIIDSRFDGTVALEFDPSLPHTRSSYRLSSHKHPDLIEQFNGWLEANSDLVQSLKQKHNIRQIEY